VTTQGLPPELTAYLLPELLALFDRLPPEDLFLLEEIRLRKGQPVLLCGGMGDAFLSRRGGFTMKPAEAVLAGEEMLQKMVLLLSGSSFYAMEEELRRGYITLPGGHRAGLAGQGVLENGRIRTMKNISSINLRLARAVPGAAKSFLPYMVENGQLCHTLLASPPRAGKTTVLRDMVRQLADGLAGLPPMNVAVADERSEIAGCVEGMPQLPIGSRTDVLDRCPKAEGMMLLIRSMAPQVLVADEIGRAEDSQALEEALHAGIKVITTAHGQNRQELLERPCTGYLLKNRFFQRLIFLSRRRGPGTLEAVYDGEGRELWRAACS